MVIFASASRSFYSTTSAALFRVHYGNFYCNTSFAGFATMSRSTNKNTAVASTVPKSVLAVGHESLASVLLQKEQQRVAKKSPNTKVTEVLKKRLESISTGSMEKEEEKLTSVVSDKTVGERMQAAELKNLKPKTKQKPAPKPKADVLRNKKSEKLLRKKSGQQTEKKSRSTQEKAEIKETEKDKEPKLTSEMSVATKEKTQKETTVFSSFKAFDLVKTALEKQKPHEIKSADNIAQLKKEAALRLKQYLLQTALQYIREKHAVKQKAREEALKIKQQEQEEKMEAMQKEKLEKRRAKEAERKESQKRKEMLKREMKEATQAARKTKVDKQSAMNEMTLEQKWAMIKKVIELKQCFNVLKSRSSKAPAKEIKSA